MCWLQPLRLPHPKVVAELTKFPEVTTAEFAVDGYLATPTFFELLEMNAVDLAFLQMMFWIVAAPLTEELGPPPNQ
jgi:hypothetical protein